MNIPSKKTQICYIRNLVFKQVSNPEGKYYYFSKLDMDGIMSLIRRYMFK